MGEEREGVAGESRELMGVWVEEGEGGEGEERGGGRDGGGGDRGGGRGGGGFLRPAPPPRPRHATSTPIPSRHRKVLVSYRANMQPLKNGWTKARLCSTKRGNAHTLR